MKIINDDFQTLHKKLVNQITILIENPYLGNLTLYPVVIKQLEEFKQMHIRCGLPFSERNYIEHIAYSSKQMNYILFEKMLKNIRNGKGPIFDKYFLDECPSLTEL